MRVKCHPGEIIMEDCLPAMGVTFQQTAIGTGIRLERLTDILNCKTAMTQSEAEALSAYIKKDLPPATITHDSEASLILDEIRETADMFMRMQQEYYAVSTNVIKHVSLDLETWGTRAGCAIRSIGAVVFDPHSDEIGDRFYQNVTSESCRKSKLHFDPDTMNWWKQQSAEAQQVFDVNPVHLKMAIMTFNEWFRSSGAEFVWGHGAAFDPPVYEAACHAVGFKVPWSYRGVRDTRTLFELAGLKTEDLPFSGTPHNALDDAVHQAMCVQRAHQILFERQLPRLLVTEDVQPEYVPGTAL